MAYNRACWECLFSGVVLRTVTLKTVLRALFVMRSETRLITPVPYNVLLRSTSEVLRRTQGKALGYVFWVLETNTLTSPRAKRAWFYLWIASLLVESLQIPRSLAFLSSIPLSPLPYYALCRAVGVCPGSLHHKTVLADLRPPYSITTPT